MCKMPGQQFRCQFCEDPFGDLIQFKTHLGLKHRNENFSEDDLIKEMIETLKSNPKQMPENIMIEKLEAHIKEVDTAGPTNMVCDKCEKTFEDDRVLRKHMRTHIHKLRQQIKQKLNPVIVIGQPFQCQQCPSKYKSSQELNKHMKIHNGQGLSCPECHRTFTGSAHLREHMMKHTGERPFPCHICDKKFRRNCELKTHLKIHSGELDFSCKICGRKFQLKSSLNSHVRLHSDEKPYGCLYCNERFKTTTMRNSHVLVYHIERNFICDLCEQPHPTKSSLFAHLRRHKKDYPHKCDTCNMRFLEASNLEQHKTLHDQGLTIFCEICEEGFTNIRESNLHHKERHRGVPLSTRDYGSNGPNDMVGQAIFLTKPEDATDMADAPDSIDTDLESVNALEQPSTSSVDESDIPENDLDEQSWNPIEVENSEQVMIKTEIPEPECIINEGAVEPEQVMIKQEPNENDDLIIC